jgi:hypothetical protein
MDVHYSLSGIDISLNAQYPLSGIDENPGMFMFIVRNRWKSGDVYIYGIHCQKYEDGTIVWIFIFIVNTRW